MRRVELEKRIEEREKEIRKKKNKEWAGTLYAEGPRVPGSQGPRYFQGFFGFGNQTGRNFPAG